MKEKKISKRKLKKLQKEATKNAPIIKEATVISNNPKSIIK